MNSETEDLLRAENERRSLALAVNASRYQDAAFKRTSWEQTSIIKRDTPLKSWVRVTGPNLLPVEEMTDEQKLDIFKAAGVPMSPLGLPSVPVGLEIRDGKYHIIIGN